jgi:hypothetical protein
VTYHSFAEDDSSDDRKLNEAVSYINKFLGAYYTQTRYLNVAINGKISEKTSTYIDSLADYIANVDEYCAYASTESVLCDRDDLIFILLSLMDGSIMSYDFINKMSKRRTLIIFVSETASIIVVATLAFFAASNGYKWTAIILAGLSAFSFILNVASNGYFLLRYLLAYRDRARIRKYIEGLRFEAETVRAGRVYAPHLRDFFRAANAGVIPQSFHRLLDLIDETSSRPQL